jgi:hypothetical protein
LKQAKLASVASQYLTESNPRAILVTDKSLTITENKAVQDKVVPYVRNGGLVIFGLHFLNFKRMDAFDNLFSGAFSLPWKHGDYHRSDFEFNPSCSLPTGAASNSFPAPFTMKALHVKNAQPHEKISIPVSGAKDSIACLSSRILGSDTGLSGWSKSGKWILGLQRGR